MKTNQSFREPSASLPIDFPTMLHALAQPGAFPFVLSSQQPIEIIQTHASAVLLAASLVYKLKKPKNFGFFDFSTPALRRHLGRLPSGRGAGL